MLFDRVYKLVFGQGGSQGKQVTNVGENGSSVAEALRVTFQIEKSASEHPNRSQITIYNLGPETRAFAEKPDLRCEFSAGYAEDRGPLLLFSGDITFAYSVFTETADVATTLELGEGAKSIRDSMVTIGLGKGAKSSQVIQKAADALGMPVNMPQGSQDWTWQHGFAYTGPARNALHRATQASGLEWSIQNNAIQVVPIGGSTNRQAVVLSSDSGLIHFPHRIRKGQQEAADVDDKSAVSPPVRKTIVSAKKHKYSGWKLKCLLIPTILPRDQVKLQSRFIEGVFTVDEVRHYGDSSSGDWITELSVLSSDDFEQRDVERRTNTSKKKRSESHISE